MQKDPFLALVGELFLVSKWRTLCKEGDTPQFNKKLSVKQFSTKAIYRDIGPHNITEIITLSVALLALILFSWTSRPHQTRVKVQQMI